MNAKMQKKNTVMTRARGTTHELFERQVELSPDSPAISFQGTDISYAELNKRSNQLAHALLQLGLQVNQPVAILLQDGPQQIVSLLGVIKAGGVIACLDWVSSRPAA